MDARLPYYLDRRLTRLRLSDLPIVAKAIVGHVRGQCKATRDFVHNTSIVRIWGDGLNVVVRGEDWEKVIPYLRDGTFNPQVVPVPVVSNDDTKVHSDVSTLDLDAPEFYGRVLGVLEGLFPEDYPTSNI